MMRIFGNGNLVKDPEELTFNEKGKICKFTLAVNERYTNEDGSRPVQYFTVITWNNIADNCLKYLKKGSKVAVYGNPQIRSYENSNGEKKQVFEIVATEVEFIVTPKNENNF